MGQGGGAPKRVNPLMWAFPASRSTLLEERDTARKDSRKKATFLSFRLNVPALDEEVALLTPDEWEHVLSRDAPDGEGLPIVGVDIGGGRAWSAAVGVWESGRVEALAIAPGEPDIDAQEKRDRVPAGTYRRLETAGSLQMADGLRVPPVSMLVDAINERWGGAACVVCDRFRLSELEDAEPGCPIEPRVAQWSNSDRGHPWAASAGARRRAGRGVWIARAADVVALSVARVKKDESGNGNQGRVEQHGPRRRSPGVSGGGRTGP